VRGVSLHTLQQSPQKTSHRIPSHFFLPFRPQMAVALAAKLLAEFQGKVDAAANAVNNAGIGAAFRGFRQQLIGIGLTEHEATHGGCAFNAAPATKPSLLRLTSTVAEMAAERMRFRRAAGETRTPLNKLMQSNVGARIVFLMLLGAGDTGKIKIYNMETKSIHDWDPFVDLKPAEMLVAKDGGGAKPQKGVMQFGKRYCYLNGDSGKLAVLNAGYGHDSTSKSYLDSTERLYRLLTFFVGLHELKATQLAAGVAFHELPLGSGDAFIAPLDARGDEYQ